MTVLLDTHFWIWWVTGQDTLTKAERQALGTAAESGELALSAISLWEAQMLHARGRLQLELPFEAWILQAAAAPVVQLLPLDVAVILALNNLPRSFHGDLADRIIVATARARDLPLATRDRGIRRSKAVRLWAVGN
ncbi:MAG TPA: type II toxin-antitoxin system VapC family toxin [Thermoanaerobaculia bacterium]|nr:type II toxin-antitoxin system VapC family toxin [Thermoanaerobaculia bacterium]